MGIFKRGADHLRNKFGKKKPAEKPTEKLDLASPVAKSGSAYRDKPFEEIIRSAHQSVGDATAENATEQEYANFVGELNLDTDQKEKLIKIVTGYEDAVFRVVPTRCRALKLPHAALYGRLG